MERERIGTMFKEIISCADGGPEPLWGMSAETAYFVGIYDESGELLSNFFDTEQEARAVYDRIKLPEQGA
jgi:hypothetical protein